jgi:serine/threonine protein phosphatase PrpC
MVTAAMSPRFTHVRMRASSRAKSEDAVEVLEHGETLVVLVADGAGGIRGGGKASEALVVAVRAALKDPTFAVEDARHWLQLFRATDGTLAKSSVGETTGVVVVLGSHQVIGVSAGDSEAWVVTATEVHDLTRGQQTKRRVGSGRAEPAVFAHAALSGTLVVASDGLFKYAASDVIARVVRESTISIAGEQLLGLVRLPSGNFADDVALVLARISP